MVLSFFDARDAVVREVLAVRRAQAVESVPLDEAAGRVLAEAVQADRDQPPFDRVTRDGFAVRAADVAQASQAAPVRLQVIDEAPPGRGFPGRVAQGQAVEIMTGAPLPAGADAVVMVEHTTRGEDGAVLITRSIAAHEHYVAQGSELRAGAMAFPAARRLDPAAIGLLASLGCTRPKVWARPRVAIVATGDELVGIAETPAATQIRNSNRHSLTAQIARAGGQAIAAPIARDNQDAIASVLREALAGADVLLASGGVSMGKYDFVEGALADLGARVAFDGVAIRPGRPLVFGVVQGKPFFGLPGNPLSTLVTFELFVRPALDLLSGMEQAPMATARLPLAAAYGQKALRLHAFVPARLEGPWGTQRVRALPSQGSGDLFAMAAADCLLVVEPGTASLPEGALVTVLPK